MFNSYLLMRNYVLSTENIIIYKEKTTANQTYMPHNIRNTKN